MMMKDIRFPSFLTNDQDREPMVGRGSSIKPKSTSFPNCNYVRLPSIDLSKIKDEIIPPTQEPRAVPEGVMADINTDMMMETQFMKEQRLRAEQERYARRVRQTIPDRYGLNDIITDPKELSRRYYEGQLKDRETENRRLLDKLGDMRGMTEQEKKNLIEQFNTADIQNMLNDPKQRAELKRILQQDNMSQVSNAIKEGLGIPQGKSLFDVMKQQQQQQAQQQQPASTPKTPSSPADVVRRRLQETRIARDLVDSKGRSIQNILKGRITQRSLDPGETLEEAQRQAREDLEKEARRLGVKTTKKDGNPYTNQSLLQMVFQARKKEAEGIGGASGAVTEP